MLPLYYKNKGKSTKCRPSYQKLFLFLNGGIFFFKFVKNVTDGTRKIVTPNSYITPLLAISQNVLIVPAKGINSVAQFIKVTSKIFTCFLSVKGIAATTVTCYGILSPKSIIEFFFPVITVRNLFSDFLFITNLLFGDP